MCCQLFSGRGRCNLNTWRNSQLNALNCAKRSSVEGKLTPKQQKHAYWAKSPNIINCTEQLWTVPQETGITLLLHICYHTNNTAYIFVFKLRNNVRSNLTRFTIICIKNLAFNVENEKKFPSLSQWVFIALRTKRVKQFSHKCHYASAVYALCSAAPSGGERENCSLLLQLVAICASCSNGVHKPNTDATHHDECIQ